MKRLIITTILLLVLIPTTAQAETHNEEILKIIKSHLKATHEQWPAPINCEEYIEERTMIEYSSRLEAHDGGCWLNYTTGYVQMPITPATNIEQMEAFATQLGVREWTQFPSVSRTIGELRTKQRTANLVLSSYLANESLDEVFISIENNKTVLRTDSTFPAGMAEAWKHFGYGYEVITE